MSTFDAQAVSRMAATARQLTHGTSCTSGLRAPRRSGLVSASKVVSRRGYGSGRGMETSYPDPAPSSVSVPARAFADTVRAVRTSQLTCSDWRLRWTVGELERHAVVEQLRV